MNYAAHYDRLIERAKNRVLSGYSERHHILPRCIGGTNAPENLVRLTAPEHMTAHLLLVFMYPANSSVFFAAHMMRLKTKRMMGRSLNKAYGWLRRRHAIATVAVHTGRKHSAEARANISRSHIGIPNNQLGRKRTEEFKARMSAARRGKPGPKWTEEQRKEISRRMTGMKGNRLGHRNSSEHRARISEAIKAHWIVRKAALNV